MKEVELSLEKIKIDFSLSKKGNISQSYPIMLSDEEKSVIPNLHHIDFISGKYDIKGDENLYSGDAYVKGRVYLIDSRDISKIIPYDFDDSVDFQVVINDDSTSDILPEKDGSYDIRTVFLALIYDAIPTFYTESELEDIDDENVSVYKEE